MLLDLLKLLNEKNNNIAIVDGEKNISYRLLNEYSDNVANNICKEKIKDSNIAIIMNKSIQYVISIIGILKSGNAYVPIDASLPRKRIEYMLKVAQVSTIITKDKLVDKFIFNDCKILIYENISEKTHKFCLENNTHNDDTAYVLFTSGSTGKSKGIMISNEAAEVFVKWSIHYFNLSSEDVFASHAPFNFDLSIFDIFVSLSVGGKLVLLPNGISSFMESLLKFVEKNKITTWYSVPNVIENVCEYLKKTNCEYSMKIKRVIYAGETMSTKAARFILRNSLIELYNLYGPSETNVVMYKNVKLEDLVDKNIPLGISCEYADIIISDGKKIILNEGIGELLVSSKSFMKKYCQNEEYSVVEFENRLYYCTGDLVRRDKNNKIFFVGRIDNQVKINGFRVELEEIERCAKQIKNLRECYAHVIKDDETNIKYIELYYVSDCNKLTEEKIIRQLKENLPEYMLPQKCVKVDEVKKNERGKIIRKRI